MNSKQRGFGVVEVLLVIVALALVASAAWYVLRGQKTNDPKPSISTNATSNTDSNTQSTKPEVKSDPSWPLQADKAKLPSGWAVTMHDSGRLDVKNASTKCFVNVLHTTNVAGTHSPEYDHKAGTRKLYKNYTINETQGKLAINTADGTRQLDAQVLQLTKGNDGSHLKKYAYISTAAAYTEVQASCPKDADIPTAEAALLAITFPKL